VCLFGSFGLFGAKVFDEAGDNSTRFVGLAIDRLECVLGEIPLIHCDVQMALNFGRGRHRDEQKLHELLVRPTDKSFGDVCHHRPGCTLDLATQSHILLPVGVLMNRLIDLASEVSRFFSAVKIFKAGNLHSAGLFSFSG